MAGAIQYGLKELADIAPEEWPDDYLTQQTAKIDKLNTDLREAAAALSVLDEEHYERRYQRQAEEAGAIIQRVLKECLRLLKLRQDLVNSYARQKKDVAAATAKIKQTRVETQLPALLLKVQAIDTQLTDLEQASPSGDRLIEALFDKYKMYNTQVDEYIKDLNSIYQDAVTCGMGSEAAEIENKLQDLKFKRTSTNEALMTLKENSNITTGTSAQRNKLVDLVNPTFNGVLTSSSLDLYTFWTEFREYSDAKNLSNEDRVILLKKVSLTGSPKALVEHEDSLDMIWDILKASYGDPMELLHAKASELKKAGKCEGNFTKRREWLIEVHAKLTRLHNIAKEHNKESDLYFSPIIGELKDLMPNFMVKDLRDSIKDWEEENKIEINREQMFSQFLKFLQVTATEETFNMRFQSLTVGSDKTISAAKPSKPAAPSKQPARQPPAKTYQAAPQQSSSQRPNNKPPQNQSKNWKPKQGQSAPKGAPRVAPTAVPGPYEEPKAINCVLCDRDHTHLFDCNNFQKKNHQARVTLAGWLRICHRCLRLDSRVNFGDKKGWWIKHKNNCVTDFSCALGKCDDKEISRQKHIVMCQYHCRDNEQRLADFITTLDQTTVVPNLKFFFFEHQAYLNSGEYIPPPDHVEGILPDVNENIPAIYLVQTIPGAKGADLLAFYDNGCSTASISARGAKILCSTTCRPGPTVLNVAGGRRLTIPHGEERFNLPLFSGKSATLTGLMMDEITDKFPVWNLQKAWQAVQDGYIVEHPQGPPLPRADEEVGGQAVDIMIGIRYNQHFPVMNYMLPGGLAVYTAQILTSSGNRGILGGAHSSWAEAAARTQYMDARAYFSSELRAYQSQQQVLTFIKNFERPKEELGEEVADLEEASHEEAAGEINSRRQLTEAVEPKGYCFDNDYFGTEFTLKEICSNNHCGKHKKEKDWLMPDNWDIMSSDAYNVSKDETKLWQVENLGTEITYRCIACRNCCKCRDGDLNEAVSLAEEVDAAILEASVTYNPDDKKLWAQLPFVLDPVEHLHPNRFIAEKIFERQMRLIEKNPEMKADILKGHAKLEDKGFVVPEDSLPPDIRIRMEKYKGPGYFIPWQIVYKAASLSTPVRLVYNASSTTPGGKSLNTILAKGANMLSKIYDVLLSFRAEASAMSCDVKMAYNGVHLQPEYYKYQRYIWKKDLDPDSDILVMVIITLIYGVKSAGGQTTVGFSLLADYAEEHHPEHNAAAKALKKAYMDDIAATAKSLEEAKKLAESISFVLALGGLAVKCFTFAGEDPEEAVSSDGVHVGMLGYKWASRADVIKLDVKELYFGKPKKGKLPPTVTDNIKEHLADNFTKREMVGLAAKVYDPLGLVAPVMAKIKLDLHDISDLKVDWDKQLPLELLDRWVENIETMQGLNNLEFKRSMIPHDAANDEIELLVFCDASIMIALAAVYARVLKTDGSYSCRLLSAKTKLVKGASVPRAELKGAVLAASMTHIVKRNLLENIKSVTYFTDSSICLFWINQDYRPLQVSVRNSVIEIRRLSLVENWFHIPSEDNIADLGTRAASIGDISTGSDWQEGKPWMKGPRDQFPTKSVKEIALTTLERTSAAAEMKAPDVGGHLLDPVCDKVALRYAFTKYIVDPCRSSWPTSVGTLGMIMRLADILKKRPTIRSTTLSTKERNEAEDYFYRLGTKEVKHFNKEKEWKEISEEKDGILYYSGRVLDGQEYNALEKVMVDLNFASFVKPMLNRYSPIAYSIMVYCHSVEAVHHNSVATLRESLQHAYIIGGRDLAEEVRKTCPKCKRYRKVLLKAAMGNVHKNRLTIGPAFTNTGIDLMGPFVAACEHNYHRATVKVWGVIFKCLTTGAVACHVMAKSDAEGFGAAYTRFASRYGHPAHVVIDQGSQLMRAAQEMNISIQDLTTDMRTNHQVGLVHEYVAVGAHNANGQCERAIQEIKKILNTVYKGLKLDILAYETSFSWTCNELNNIPICIGSRYKDLDHLDLITPNRLLLGRNNRRAQSGCSTFDAPHRVQEQIEQVYEAWWDAWKREKLVQFVPQPKKWDKTDYVPKLGDIVIFTREEQVYGKPVWRTGRIVTLKDNPHGKYSVELEYKVGDDPRAMQLKTTWRATRSIAVIHKEGELELVDQLNSASKAADVHFIIRESSRATRQQFKSTEEDETPPWGWTQESCMHSNLYTWAN